MSIDNYRKGFLPVLDRKVIEAEIRLNINILGDVVKPVLPLIGEELTDAKIKSDALKKLAGVYNRMVRTGSMSLFASLNKKTDEAVESLHVLLKELNKYIPSKFSTTSMNYRQLAIIRSIEAIGHWVEFTQHFIFYALSAENAKESGTQLKDLLSSATIREVEKGFVNYCEITRTLILPGKETSKLLSTTPELVVQNTDDSAASVVHGDLNPTRAGFISTRFNPVFRVLSVWDEYQAKRYHLAREMLRAYEVQLLHLKQLKDRTEGVNPSVEARIEELTSLIEELRFKLNKVRQKHGLEEEF